MGIKKISTRKLIIMALCVSTAVVLLIVFRGPVFGLFYHGDRVKGEVRVSVDGEIHTLTEKDITPDPNCPDSAKMTVSFNGGIAEVSMPAKKAGKYSFYVAIPGTDVPVKLVLEKKEWWKVFKYRLTADYQPDRGKVEFGLYYKNGKDEGSLTRYQNIKSKELTVSYVK